MQRITDMKLNRPYILYICICLWLLFLPSCTNRLWGKDFVVVIDAGHGGHDPGAIGKISKEKNINLNVALKVGNLIKKNCDDVKLIYTRSKDVFIPLARRAEIANNAKADLFISIHTNALANNRTAKGASTWTLGLAKSEANLEVAKRENAVILYESDYETRYAGFNPNSAESYIIFEFMQDKYMEQSVHLASLVQKQFRHTCKRVDRGVHQAGFLVLKASAMPSILVELGFISTPEEERYLNSEAGANTMANGIYRASSPEGARDYIVPSRKYKGKFYALPQAPQQYKQLLMVSGFDKYFQIAPCFRDEDARADRSPGEFYQLDFEMSFATQEDVFRIGEEVLTETFAKFAPEGYEVTQAPYPIISYKQAMLEFGSDKPDLRNPLRIIDLSEFFNKCTFKPFQNKTVRAINVHAKLSKGQHEKLLKFATGIGMGGLGYLEVLEDGSYKGPIDKFIPEELKGEIKDLAGLQPGDTIFFIADKEDRAAYFAGQIRNELGERLDLIEKNAYRFCYVNDFPMFERDPETKKIGFTHNPFSMPQGGLEALNTKDPLDILAYQYDIVCNGVELSSGAVRNHDMQIMVKAFEIAGYDEEVLKAKFGALYNAFQFGAPPHAGMAPGVDRMIMLLRNEENIREIIPFPMSGTAQDLMCGAPNEVTEQQLREVHIKVRD